VGINRDKPDLWKADIKASVDLYNRWFMQFAPEAFRNERKRATTGVEEMLRITCNFRCVTADLLKANPAMLPALRMACCPPIARDRLTGLSYASKSLVNKMDCEGKIPSRMEKDELTRQLTQIGNTVEKLADKDIMIWLGENRDAKKDELKRAASIIADRLCGANADPIIRNTQEKRQLALIRE
jgi:hypothetical protein